jgi:hypothetical protein
MFTPEVFRFEMRLVNLSETLQLRFEMNFLSDNLTKAVSLSACVPP